MNSVTSPNMRHFTHKAVNLVLSIKRGEMGLRIILCCCEAQAQSLIWDGALGNLYCCCCPDESQVKSGTGPAFVLTM